MAEDSPPDEGSPYAPLQPPPGQGVCSWCGDRQGLGVLVVMNHDGTAGICDSCVKMHAQFFERHR